MNNDDNGNLTFFEDNIGTSDNSTSISDITSDIEILEKFDTLIELHEKQYTMMAQNNTNQLFVIGAFSGIIVLVLLYSAIKKFI